VRLTEKQTALSNGGDFGPAVAFVEPFFGGLRIPKINESSSMDFSNGLP
jgi:hypothetical protein